MIHARHLLTAFIFYIASVSFVMACGFTHVVQRGDTLSKLARDNMGSIFAYQVIYDANRDLIGDDPNLIRIGTSLDIPCVGASADGIDWSVMPTAPVLAAILQTEDVQILDIRTPEQIAGGVIPGAVSAPFALWRGPADNLGHPPTPAKLSAVIGDAGLDLSQPIIVIHEEATMMDIGRAAMVYWLLKSSGAETLAILRDGFESWDADGRLVARTPVAPIQRDVTVTFSDDWHASIIDVYGIATDQVDGYLLDARPYSVFRRIDALGNALGNTIPGARNAPIQTLMATLAGYVDIEDGAKHVVAHLMENRANWTKGPVVTFCNTGEVGALSWFYASELAGLENMQLYPDSVNGWAYSGGVLALGDI